MAADYPFEPQAPPDPGAALPTQPPVGGATIPFPDVQPGSTIPYIPGMPGGPTAGPANAIPDTLQNLQPTNLLSWGQSVEYDWDFGLRCSPPAESGAADPVTLSTPYQQFWRCHAGKTRKTITCIGVGGGTKNPTMPAPSTINPGINNGNDVLVKAKAVGFTPENFMDGIQCRAVLLILVFECQAMIQLGTDVLDFGASPFDSTPCADNVLLPEDFQKLYNQASRVLGFNGGPITF